MNIFKSKLQLPVLILIAVSGLVIYLYFNLYESKYITVKLSGDAEKFSGYFLNDKGNVEGITLDNELPQEHRLKTNRLYCRIELISGENIFVEYRSKGELIEKDTVTSGIYKKNISIDKDEYKGTLVPAEPPLDLPPAGMPPDEK
jgi:hypothetical protein